MILYGERVGNKLLSEVKEYAKTHKMKLAIITNPFDEASKVYVRNKVKKCTECGIETEVIEFANQTAEEYKRKIRELNFDEEVTGIICQLPLANSHIDVQDVMDQILPSKDVDAFGVDSKFAPCTPQGIIYLLDYYNFKYDGKIAVVIGRSDIVGKPMCKLLLNKNMTVINCHSHTKKEDLDKLCSMADLIVSAVGKPNTVTVNMVKDGATIIDVGINRVNGKLCGDCDFENLKDFYCDITPVPKGVGITTVATLVYRLMELDKKYNKENNYETKNINK